MFLRGHMLASLIPSYNNMVLVYGSVYHLFLMLSVP
jgi:hypothetical protein